MCKRLMDGSLFIWNVGRNKHNHQLNDISDAKGQTLNYVLRRNATTVIYKPGIFIT